MKTFTVTKHVILALTLEAEADEDAWNQSWRVPIEQWDNLDTTAVWVEQEGTE